MRTLQWRRCYLSAYRETTMASTWRLVVSPPSSGRVNMAVDEAMLAVARETRGEWQPTLRIYGWDSTSLSLGRFQDTDRGTDSSLLDRGRCAESGTEIVRRPTGGRALLHHPGDVTYSIVARADDSHLGEDVIGSYRSVNQALVAGLGALGIRARIRERPPTWPSAGVGFACFEEAYRHEVYWAGRKLVAGAQRRQGRIVLQQGTMPGRETSEQIASLLRLDPATRSLLKRDLGERTGTLERALDQLPSLEIVVDAMVQGFREAWDVEFDQRPLTGREEQTAEEIAASNGVVA